VKSVEAVNITSELRPPKKRAWVKIDKYAFDYFDHHELSASERHVLLAICLEVRWQDLCWHGSITDLSGRTRMGRKTVSDAMKSLLRKGVLEPVHDFNSNSLGQFRLVDYYDLIIPEVHSGGRPKGSKDREPRERTSAIRDETEAISNAISTATETHSPQTEQIESPNNLMMGENRYNTPREAEIREEVIGVDGVVGSEETEPAAFATLGQHAFSDLDMPCGICGEQDAGHIWATEDGRGHDWVPRKGGTGYAGF